MSDELKPCPFCGSKHIRTSARTCNKDSKYNPDDRAFPIVRCLECGACAEGRDWSEPITAITKWNTRAQSPCGADGAVADDELAADVAALGVSLAVGGYRNDAELLYKAAEKLRLLASQPAAPVAPATVAVPDDVAKDAIPLNGHTRWILGRPNFACGPIASVLRSLGHEIEHKAEDEQAAVIHWMLSMYAEYGENWKRYGEKYLATVKDAAILSADTEVKNG